VLPVAVVCCRSNVIDCDVYCSPNGEEEAVEVTINQSELRPNHRPTTPGRDTTLPGDKEQVAEVSLVRSH
jgi:hypothetical protein